MNIIVRNCCFDDLILYKEKAVNISLIFQISDSGTTYFVHSVEQGLMAAVNASNDTLFYYEFDGDG